MPMALIVLVTKVRKAVIATDDEGIFWSVPERDA